MWRMTLPVAAWTADPVFAYRLFDARPLLTPLTVPARDRVGDLWKLPASDDRPAIARHVRAAEAAMRMEARSRTVAWDLCPEHRRPRVLASGRVSTRFGLFKRIGVSLGGMHRGCGGEFVCSTPRRVDGTFEFWCSECGLIDRREKC